jgi:hypothetical protein
VQTIPWGQLVGEARVLPNPCGGGALYEFEVYLTGVGTRSGPALKGFLVIKKKCLKKRLWPFLSLLKLVSLRIL